MTTSRSLRVAGRRRTYQLSLPLGPTSGAPLVLAFHGSNQTGASLSSFVGGDFDELAARDGAVVAYLDGYKRNWNDARKRSVFAARLEGYDDVAFTTAVIDELVDEFALDRGRVFGVGFSNGGAMLIRLAHELGDDFAGLAILSATLPVADNFAVDRDTLSPLPVLLFHGTRDRLVPYEGGMASLWGFKPRGLGLSARATADYFAERNGITSAPVAGVLTGGALPVSVLDYASTGKPPVRLVTVEGGGHTIPGSKKAPFVMGRTATTLRAVDEIADFFQIRRQE